MANVSDLLTRVIPYAVGCSDIMAERCVLDAASEFCRRTMAIEEVKTLTVPVGGAIPAITFATDMQALMVMEAFWNNLPLELTTVIDLGTQFPTWRNYGQGTPSHLYSSTTDPDGINLFPAPSVGGILVVRFATLPTRTATTIPDALANFWTEAIAYGALARILRLPNQPFTSPQGSAEYEAMFQTEISKARLEVMDSRTRGRHEIKRFAFGSR